MALPRALHKLLERLDNLGCRGPGLGEATGDIASMRASRPIGLGEQAHGLGEQPGAQRVDDAHRIANGQPDCGGGCAMPFSCRLDCDQLHVMMRQPTDDLFGTCLGIGHPEGSSEGRMWISSHNLQTSIPTVDLVLVSCSDRSLPCMRDLLPIICSGQEPRERTDHAHRRGSFPRGHTVPSARAGDRGRGPRAPITLQVSRQMTSACVATKKGVWNRVRGSRHLIAWRATACNQAVLPVAWFALLDYKQWHTLTCDSPVLFS